MEIKGEYQSAAMRDVVWQALNDPDMLNACIPGCEEFQRAGENEFRSRVKATIGPVRAIFITSLSLEDLNPPECFRLVG